MSIDVHCVFTTYQVLVVQGGSGHKRKRDACLSSGQGLQRKACITHKSHFTSNPLWKSAYCLCRSSLLNQCLSCECYKCSILMRLGRANRTRAVQNYIYRPYRQNEHFLWNNFYHLVCIHIPLVNGECTVSRQLFMKEYDVMESFLSQQLAQTQHLKDK